MSTSHIFSHLLLTRDRDVAVLTINRADKLNALNRELINELSRALTALGSDTTLGALVIVGAGEKAFVAGTDVGELRESGAVEALNAHTSRLAQQLDDFPRPTVAAIRGYCLGVGCELACACDIRVSGVSGQFGLPEVKLGMIPAAGATQRLPRLIGLGRAKELIFSGDVIEAPEAYRIGLVNRVVDDDKVLDEARHFAEKFARRGRLAIRAAKLALNEASRSGLTSGLLVETLAQAVCFDSSEKRVRMTEFLEKKK